MCHILMRNLPDSVAIPLNEYSDMNLNFMNTTYTYNTSCTFVPQTKTECALYLTNSIRIHAYQHHHHHHNMIVNTE